MFKKGSVTLPFQIRRPCIRRLRHNRLGFKILGTSPRVLAALACLSTAWAGCHTLPDLPPADLAAPGWTIRQGQAVWHPDAQSDGLAGELLLATQPDERVFVQFSKVPLVLVTAQRTANAWEVHFPSQDRRAAAHGTPPEDIIWPHLGDALLGEFALDHWSFTRAGDGGFRLAHRKSGELLEGYLDPPLPETCVTNAGDTPSAVARRHGITTAALRQANPGVLFGADSAPLPSGTTLHIPSP